MRLSPIISQAKAPLRKKPIAICKGFIFPKMESENNAKLPQKRYFRQRAHCNPFSDHNLSYPISPDQMDWSSHFPASILAKSNQVEFVDVGCGYGGLLISLSSLFPSTLMLGMEIRIKVEEYVKQRIQALRQQNPSQYENISVLRTNAMKFLPNFFKKGQLSKMFFLFPDPHFKRKKHKARIINDCLLAEYAFVLREEGMLYVATDVLELYEWMTNCLNAHPLFKRIDNTELENDPVIECITNSTEEGKKVARNNGDKYWAVYRRIRFIPRGNVE